MTAIDVLVRVVHLGRTPYLAWTWLDDTVPHAQRLDRARVARVLSRLDAALIPEHGDGETGCRLSGILRGGELSITGSEESLASELGAALLAPDLVERIIDLGRAGVRVRFRVTPIGGFARVPWELVVTDEATGRRLLEDATVVLDPPTTVHVGRTRPPVSWRSVAKEPPVYVVDPELPRSARLAGLLPALADPEDRMAFEDRIDQRRRRAGGELPGGWAPVQGMALREELGHALRDGPSRLFYFGHVSADVDDPGSAALHLSDEVAVRPCSLRGTVGHADPLGLRGPSGVRRRARPGDHLPLCALDLVLGTTGTPHRDGDGIRGADLWPMPPRVAIIACEGAVDYRSSEPFGLVTAMLDSGAELVTSTRWVLPTDEGLRVAGGLGDDDRPVIEVALAVDSAHETDDPVESLRRWQLGRLEAWRGGGLLKDSPLLWAAVSTTVAEARDATPSPGPAATA